MKASWMRKHLQLVRFQHCISEGVDRASLIHTPQNTGA